MTEIQKPPQTPRQPIENFHGMSERVTLPGSKIEVVIRQVDTEVITLDGVSESASAGELLQVAAAYAESSTKTMSDSNVADMMKLPTMALSVLEMMRRSRNATLREAVVAPSLDELREIYGGRRDSADLGMGRDYSFLSNAVERFNSKKGGDAAKEAAQDFLGALGSSTTPDGESVQQAAE